MFSWSRLSSVAGVLNNKLQLKVNSEAKFDLAKVVWAQSQTNSCRNYSKSIHTLWGFSHCSHELHCISSVMLWASLPALITRLNVCSFFFAERIKLGQFGRRASVFTFCYRFSVGFKFELWRGHFSMSVFFDQTQRMPRLLSYFWRKCENCFSVTSPTFMSNFVFVYHMKSQ